MDMILISCCVKKTIIIGFFITIIYSLYLIYYYIQTTYTPLTIPKCHGCAGSNVSYIMNLENACSLEVKIVIVILSHVNYHRARTMIRETWGNMADQYRFHSKIIFVVGKSEYETSKLAIRKEYKEFKDIVQLDFIEDYRKLSHKTILAFRWFKSYCKNAKYILKTDDDVFINLQNLLHILDRYNFQNAIAGNCFGYEFPDRHNESKWYVSYEEFPDVKYPPYCSGGGYLLQRSTALKLYEASLDTPYFPMEDVYVGFLAYKLGIRTLSIPGFYIFSKPSSMDYYCRCLVLRHRVKVTEGYKIWRNITCWNNWDRNKNYPCIEVWGEVSITVVTFISSIFMLILIVVRVRIK